MDREGKRRLRKRSIPADEKKKERRSKLSKKESKEKSKKSSSRSKERPKLTSNAVELLSNGSMNLSDDNDVKEKKKKLVVRLRLDRGAKSDIDEQAMTATISDGKHCMKVLVLNPSGELTAYAVDTEKDLIVSVHGYVTTEGQSTKYQLHTVVCLTSISVISVLSSDRFELGSPFRSPAPQQSARVHAGTIGTFMSERAPFLTNEELAGSADLSEKLVGISSAGDNDETKVPSISMANHEENLENVGQFLARHSAMVTLSCSSKSLHSDTLGTPTKRPAEHAVQNYNDGIKEFVTSQIDRQKASLGTNAGREAADRACLITERHNAALKMALEEKSPFSKSVLCSWHAALLEDLHQDAGTIRSKTVRAGHTVFAPPDRIQAELEMLFDGMQSLQKRLNMNNALHAILFAAVAMYGVVDIHPFLDGNGRLSRMVANWALRQAGLPFPINLFATPSQRTEYVLAMEKTRHFLSLTNTNGSVAHDEVLLCIKHTGVFAPLIRLLMDRVARAVLECNRVLEEKSGLAAEAAEARAARRVRERSAQGTCIICLDEKPNIATLCCGKAVHLNCIAEWLSAKNSCPVCRSGLPGISGRVVRAASRDFLAEDEENESRRRAEGRIQNARDVIVSLLSPFDTTTTADDSSEVESRNGSTSTTSGEEDGEEEQSTSDSRQQQASANNVNTTIDVDDTTTTSEAEDDRNSESSNNDSSSSIINEDMVDDTTTTISDSEENGNGGGEDTTTTMVIETPTQPEAPRYCDALYCRNRPAVDCVNKLCGRCCVLGGRFHCPRHNS